VKAIVKTKPGPGNVDLVDVAEPELTPGGVKIRVAWSGICGTDLHVYHDTFRNYPPVILGHEFSGVVEAVGSEVASVSPGDRVTALPSSAVIEPGDPYWRRGYYMFSRNRRGMGHGVNGSFTEFVVVREDQVYPLLDDVSLEEAALSEPLASAYQPICELAVFRPGDTVLLSGPGPIGLLCLILLVRQGCRVIAAGAAPDQTRLEMARSLGAAATVNISETDLAAAVAAETGGRGVDGAVEAAGAAASIQGCLDALRPMGQYVQVGIAGHEVQVNFDAILFKQLHVYGSLGHSLQTWEAVMELLRRHTIDVTPLITHRLPLNRWREAFDLCERKQGVKVLLHYGEESA